MNQLTYEEVEILVMAHKEGSKDATEQLIKAYEGYIQKIVGVIKNKNFQIGDRTQRNFIRLFAKDKEIRKNLHLFRESAFIQKAIYGTLNNVAERFEHIPEEDFMQEAKLILLQIVDRYEIGGQFHAYFVKSFSGQFYNSIIKWALDPYHHKIIPFNEETEALAYYDEINYDEFDEPNYRINISEDSPYDINWINGFGCGELFNELTPYERRILKLYYEGRAWRKDEMNRQLLLQKRKETKLTEQQIADRLGCSRKTVNIKRNEIKQKVENIALSLNLLQE